MRVDGEVVAPRGEVGARARELVSAGADGLLTFEDEHDPFFPLVVAAATGRGTVDLYPSCAVGFPRSPTHLAQMAWNLHAASGGRFALALASQVRPHIERRFSSVWGRPVEHMGELVGAIRAVFDSWTHRSRIDFAGDYYALSLMTPAFTPPPLPTGPPPIWIGALGPRMTALAGTVADGQIVHGFNTQPYLLAARFHAHSWTTR